MTVVGDLSLPKLDLSDPGLKGELWHAGMRSMLDSGEWMAEAPLATVILDREAGEFFLRSKSAVFPGLLLAQIFGIEDGPLYEQIVNNIINVNGETHRRLRGLVNPSLSPRAAATYRPAMREFLEALWGDIEGREEFDFVEAFARPYPSLTISRVMGAPPRDAPRLHDWSMWIQRQFDPIALTDPEAVAVIQEKVGEFYAWVRPMIEHRRETPSKDLISSLIATEEEGERLSDVELENLVLNILVGGVDTTQNQLAHAIRLLAENPEQWEALRADPEGLAPRAAMEALRFEPITPFTARQLMEEVSYRDVTFPEGTVIMVCAYTGNRDPEAFAEPMEFDITTDREKARVLTFGAGFHYCVGANLAKAELEEGLRFFAERIETVELAGRPELQTVSGIYGIDSLPIRISRSAGA
ncbi:MAG TPA: cytochrome P450 [Solirubrobacterales bacterium]|nr:cytochrome P450 [Solirubrobacterales bacterium]